MSKGNVFIVMVHHNIRNNKTKKMEVHEKIEFVDDLKTRHITSATVILDYLNRKIVKNRGDTGTYEEFEAYVTNACPKQMAELEEYRAPSLVIEDEPDSPVIIDADTIER